MVIARIGNGVAFAPSLMLSPIAGAGVAEIDRGFRSAAAKMSSHNKMHPGLKRMIVSGFLTFPKI